MGWSTGSLLASNDRINWQVRSRIDAYDLAVDPGRAETVLATTEQGIQRSADGGRTWLPAGEPAALLLHWSDPDQLHAVGTDGRILRSVDGGRTWSDAGGRVPDAPAIFTAYDEHVFVATRDGRVLRSADAGTTWQPLSAPRAQHPGPYAEQQDEHLTPDACRGGGV